MTASVSVLKVEMTGFNPTDSTYSGSVTYRVESDSIRFEYIHRFEKESTAENAMVNGAAFLKRELDELSNAAVLPRFRP